MQLEPTALGPDAVPLRARGDALLHLGLLLLLVGLCWPWIRADSCYSGSSSEDCITLSYYGPMWLIDELTSMAPGEEIGPVPWPCWLPLLYGFALPALWCSSCRHGSAVRLTLAWLWMAALFGWLAWVWSDPVMAQWNVIRPMPGIAFSAVGAVIVGLGPMIELHRLRRMAARWRARPGAVQATDVIDPRTLPWLSPPLRRLVCEARALRISLDPLQPLDGGQLQRLTEILASLRSLDDRGHTELHDHGQRWASALLEALAPAEPRDESTLEEALRLDAALSKLEAMGLQRTASAPYR